MTEFGTVLEYAVDHLYRVFHANLARRELGTLVLYYDGTPYDQEHRCRHIGIVRWESCKNPA
jgi:hypothetical protein